MKIQHFLQTLMVFVSVVPAGKAQDSVQRVRKAVERSTLDQAGTKPFHLLAKFAPSLERVQGTGRTGEVEIWWESPTRWRREVRSPQFRQIEIVNRKSDWQKNEGDYFPEWLREVAIALVRPVPDLYGALGKVKNGETRTLLGSTHISWVDLGSDGVVSKGIGAGITLKEDGFEFGSGLGWSAGISERMNFHGRMVARSITSGGSPEITAEVDVLEDLKTSDLSMFESGSGVSDALLKTVVVDELMMRKNLGVVKAPDWPTLENGPLQGVLIAEVMLDTQGHVREVGSVLSDNPGISAAAEDYIRKFQFNPYVVEGLPVQVVTTFTMPFKTTRPAGMESFESARTYFERGREVGFLAAGHGKPYVLRAEFETRGSSGAIEKGTYTDTWSEDGQWRREALLGKSRFISTRNGDKRYMLAEGPDAGVLQLVLKIMEPIPAIDTFVESDWRIRREDLDGVSVIRVASGYESPDGKPDAERFRGFWFDDKGQVVKTYLRGLETRRLLWKDFDGKRMARRVDLLSNGKLAMRVVVTDVVAADAVDKKTFILPGHEWQRKFTDEVR